MLYIYLILSFYHLTNSLLVKYVNVCAVAVLGDGDTDLDLYIYDSNDNLIAYDSDYTDQCYCRWVPAWTDTFRIKIVNRGSVYNEFVLVTN
mgnify:CR=1 FL=1